MVDSPCYPFDEVFGFVDVDFDVDFDVGVGIGGGIGVVVKIELEKNFNTKTGKNYCRIYCRTRNCLLNKNHQ